MDFILLVLLIYILVLPLPSYSSPLILKLLTESSPLKIDYVTVGRCRDKYLYYTLVLPIPQHHPLLSEKPELGCVWEIQYKREATPS